MNTLPSPHLYSRLPIATALLAALALTGCHIQIESQKPAAELAAPAMPDPAVATVPSPVPAPAPLLDPLPPAPEGTLRAHVESVVDTRTTLDRPNCRLTVTFLPDDIPARHNVLRARVTAAQDDQGRDLALGAMETESSSAASFRLMSATSRMGQSRTTILLRNPSRRASTIRVVDGFVDFFLPSETNGALLRFPLSSVPTGSPIQHETLAKYGIELTPITEAQAAELRRSMFTVGTSTDRARQEAIAAEVARRRATRGEAPDTANYAEVSEREQRRLDAIQAEVNKRRQIREAMKHASSSSDAASGEAKSAGTTDDASAAPASAQNETPASASAQSSTASPSPDVTVSPTPEHATTVHEEARLAAIADDVAHRRALRESAKPGMDTPPDQSIPESRVISRTTTSTSSIWTSTGLPNAVSFQINDPDQRIANIELQDARGTPLRIRGTSTMAKVRTVNLAEPLPEDAQLVVYVATNEAITSRPFRIEHILLP